MLNSGGGAGSDSDSDNAYLAMASSLAPHRDGGVPTRYQRTGITGFCMRLFRFCCAWLASQCKCIIDLCSCCCGSAVRVNGRRLRVVRMLGEGAYAQVLEVVDSHGKHLALKRMILQEVDQRAMAQKEIRTHQALGNSCPYIMPLLDHEIVVAGGGTREDALLVFPFFSGSLQGILEQRAPSGRVFDEAHALQRLAEVCVGVERLHTLDPPLAHRDIKPANIMITQNGQAVLGDFGSVGPALVQVTSRFQALNLQEEAAQFCSMPYRAPELFDIPSNGTLRPNTDVWSLGCTLYAMMYGYSPFECEFRDDGTARVVECTHLRVLGPIRFPRTRNRGSQQFMGLVKWMLQADPAKRPSLNAVMDRLEAMGTPCTGRLPVGTAESKV